MTTTDGRHRIAVLSGGEVRIALVFRVVGTRIAHYEVIADPHRLALLGIEAVEDGGLT